MSKRIEDNHYTAMEQFEHDFNLVIGNCMRYNAPDTIYYRAALKLRDQGRPIVRAARRQVERAGIDPVTGLHTEEPPTLADREPTEEGEPIFDVSEKFCYDFFLITDVRCFADAKGKKTFKELVQFPL